MIISDFITEVQKLGISLDEDKLNKLEKYYKLLIEWNEKINLTGITKKEEVYLKHFYDSLTLFNSINLYDIDTLCDLGTGAGFPGLVLKIVFPNLKVTLVDSLNKRIKFLDTVIKTLELDNIETKCVRAEEYAKIDRGKYDLVVARAVASLPILLEYAIPLVKVNGFFIAMKGNQEDINISNIEKILSIKLESINKFILPIEESQRTLYKFLKISSTNSKYPRRYAEIKNKPLK